MGGAYKLLTNCPSCTLSLEQGRELMREAGEPMECGIFDFYKVFSRAFSKEENGAGGIEWEVRGCRPDHATTGLQVRGIHRLEGGMSWIEMGRTSAYSMYK